MSGSALVLACCVYCNGLDHGGELAATTTAVSGRYQFTATFPFLHTPRSLTAPDNFGVMAKRGAAEDSPAGLKRQSSVPQVVSDFWAANPTMSYLTGLSLLSETKQQMEKLWSILDVNKDGALTAADWTTVAGGGGKWDLLRGMFDFTSASHNSNPRVTTCAGIR